MSDINITVQDEIVNIDVIDTPVYVEVTNSPGPAGPAGVGVPVGGTTGQVLAKNSATNYDTAWVNASGGGVPYSGATGNVNLGEYELKAGQLTLDVSPTGTAAVGTTRWNDTTGVSETTLKGGNVLLRNGVDLVARVVNKVTPNTTLTKAAYQAVRVSGAQGQRLAVAFAQANNDANSADTIGLVIETIPTNQEGFIMAVGQLENINTTGSLQGETWVDGDVLYLSPTIAGAITKVKPTGNGHIVVIGYVEYAHANNGKIYVKVMNGWELDELHDVSIVSVANNEALIYESSSALWKNKSISTALGYTPANAATTLTINGVTYDLSTSRTWTVAAGISGSGTPGQVTYWSGSSAVSGSNNLFWDNTNGRLGIGTNAPVGQLNVNQVAGTTKGILISGDEIFATGNGVADKGVRISVGVNRLANRQLWIGDSDAFGSATASIFRYQTGQTGYASLDSVTGDGITRLLTIIGTETSNVGIGSNALTPTTAPYTSKLNVFTLNTSNSNLQLRKFGTATGNYLDIVNTSGTTIAFLNNSGNLNIGTTDLGVRLGVVGDTLLRGSGASSTTTALTVQNSSSTNLFTVRNDGLSTVNQLLSSTGTTSQGTLIVGGASTRYTSNTGINTTGIYMSSAATDQDLFVGYVGGSATTNIYSYFQSNGYIGTRGALRLGAASGTDVLTSVTNTWLSIAAGTTTRSQIRLASSTAPTTPNDGDIWFDGTDIKMRIGGVTKTFTLI